MSSKQQLVTFLFIGILNTLFGYSCYAGFLFLGLSYPFAMLGSTIIGLLFNFKTTGKFVFKNSNNFLIFKFITVYIALYFFNITLIGTLKLIFPDLYIAGFLAIFPTAILGFLLNRNLVFKPINQD